MRKITGVVALLTAPDGRVVAHASDFDHGNPAGYTLEEAQQYRAGLRLNGAVLEATCSDLVAQAVIRDNYLAEQVMGRLLRAGCVRTFVAVEAEIGSAPRPAAEEPSRAGG